MILITGGSGQLGTEVRRLFDKNEINYVSPNSKSFDVTNSVIVNNFILESKPEYIIHCAAYTAVDLAEDDGKALNMKINANGTMNIAKAARKVGATIIYISTDYVFDGQKQGTQYKVDDPTNPLNEYGYAKLLGENAIKENIDKFYILRTSWVFGEYGNNFVYTMKKLALKNRRLTVVNDQFGRPTWTKTIADFIYFILTNNPNYGIYHISNEQSCTWYEFAKEILKDENDLEIVPVTSEEFPQKAKRPQYSVMDLSKVKYLGFKIPTWKEALEMMLTNQENS